MEADQCVRVGSDETDVNCFKQWNQDCFYLYREGAVGMGCPVFHVTFYQELDSMQEFENLLRRDMCCLF